MTSTQHAGLPGLRGTDHVGLTVPDLKEAVRFLTEVIGAEYLYEVPTMSDPQGRWFETELGVHPRTTLVGFALLRCGSGVNLEVFQFDAVDEVKQVARVSDYGYHHIALYVDDMAAAVAALKAREIEFLGGAKPGVGPEEGQQWVFFRTPWGLPMELVSYPNGRAYERHTDRRLWNAAHPGR